MTALAKLKLVSVQADRNSATIVRRLKLKGKIQSQISLAKALAAGDFFTAKKVKFVTAQESGERKAVGISSPVKPWWFTTQAGKLVLALRYGAKPLEISKGKNAIEVIKQATQAGERPALNSTSLLSLHQSGKSESIRAI